MEYILQDILICLFWIKFRFCFTCCFVASFFKFNNSPIIFYAKMGFTKYYIEDEETTHHLEAPASLPEDPCWTAHNYL